MISAALRHLLIWIALSCAHGMVTAGCGADAGQSRTRAAAPPRSENPAPTIDRQPEHNDNDAFDADAAAGAVRARAEVEGADSLTDDSIPAEADIPLVNQTTIEDPGKTALSNFHAALARTQNGEGQARLVFYGASHVASDFFTNAIRQRLQVRFGEAGAGFVLPAKPWRWYRHSGIRIERSRGWDVLRVRAWAPKHDRYGFAGVALQSGADRWAIGAIETRRNGEVSGHASRFELYYMKQPNGGRLIVFLDGKRLRGISTASKRPETGYALFEVPDAHHRFEVRAIGNGPVRIFGVAVERDTPGVILDTVGIPGGRARYHLEWEDAIYREHLARRKPDLIALAYGTNEAGDDDVPIEYYEQRLREMLGRIRQTVPQASCLLIGPSDRPLRLVEDNEENKDAKKERKQNRKKGRKKDDGNDEKSYGPRPRTEQIIAVQRRVASETGCGFFDVVHFMGGPMSMVRWAAADPPLGSPDHVHFTRRGYRLLGEELARALLADFTQDEIDDDNVNDASTKPAAEAP